MFPIIPANTATASFPENDEGIFGYGTKGGPGGVLSITNLISNAGVVSSDVAGVGTVRRYLAATQYGGDKGIFGYGWDTPSRLSMTNLVSNTGVVSSDTTGVGTARTDLTACSYGEDKGLFGFGVDPTAYATAVTNLVSNAGVVATDTAGVGTARTGLGSCEYGGDKGIFGFGTDYAPTYAYVSITNLVSNAGVVASDQAATTGTARSALKACSYGGDKGIFGFGSSGSYISTTNLVSNAGVVASDVAGVGTARNGLAGCSFN